MRLGVLRSRIGRGATAEELSEYELLRSNLVIMHLNVVQYLALTMSRRGSEFNDVIQVGTLGLIKAVDRFDSERNVEFITFAMPTITGEIKRYFRDEGWAVKVPRRLQEMSLALNRAAEEMTNTLNRTPSIVELAERLGISEEQIFEVQEIAQAQNALSLDAGPGNGSRKPTTLLDYLSTEDVAFAQVENRADLERAFDVLTSRERLILYLGFYHDVPQMRIASRLNVSQMHISRLKQKALAKLKSILSTD